MDCISQSDDGKYLIMGNGTRAFAIAAEQPENYLKTAEQTTEQNYNMIDGQINNTPTVPELTEKAKAGGQIFPLQNTPKPSKQKRNRQNQRKSPLIRAQLRADKTKDRTEKSGKNKKSRIGGMSMIRLTVEEMNLLSIYHEGSKVQLIENMTAALPFMDEDMRPFAERTLQKISPLTENEYAKAAIFAADEVCIRG